MQKEHKPNEYVRGYLKRTHPRSLSFEEREEKFRMIHATLPIRIRDHRRWRGMPRLFKIKIQTQRNCFGGISKELTLGPSLSREGRKIPDDSCNPPDKKSGPPPMAGHAPSLQN